MKKLIASIAIAAGIAAFGATAHADTPPITGPADPIAQVVPAADDCIGGTTRWTLQPCSMPQPEPQQAAAPKIAPRQCSVAVGELQHVVVNIAPPCRLDVYLFPGKLHGLTPAQRCTSGTLGSGRFHGKTYRVCRGVDY